MLDAAGKALFKPFEISLFFADPRRVVHHRSRDDRCWSKKTLREKKDHALLRGAARLGLRRDRRGGGPRRLSSAALEGRVPSTLVARDGSDRTNQPTPPRSIGGSA